MARRGRRGGALVVVKARRPARDAWCGSVIGKPMVSTDFVGVEDGTSYDLSALRGRMAIVGLYNPACVDCASLFGRFLEWSRDRARREGTPPLVLAVWAGEPTRDV